jgi:hypothetical protein
VSYSRRFGYFLITRTLLADAFSADSDVSGLAALVVAVARADFVALEVVFLVVMANWSEIGQNIEKLLQCSTFYVCNKRTKLRNYPALSQFNAIYGDPKNPKTPKVLIYNLLLFF